MARGGWRRRLDDCGHSAVNQVRSHDSRADPERGLGEPLVKKGSSIGCEGNKVQTREQFGKSQARSRGGEHRTTARSGGTHPWTPNCLRSQIAQDQNSRGSFMRRIPVSDQRSAIKRHDNTSSH